MVGLLFFAAAVCSRRMRWCCPSSAASAAHVWAEKTARVALREHALCMPTAVGQEPLPALPSPCVTSECPDRMPLSTVLIREIWDMLLHAGKTGSCGTRAALLKRGGVSSDLPREHIGR